jgi:hypothetical protein
MLPFPRSYANAGLALDQQSEGARRDPVETPFDRLQFGLATDNRVHVASCGILKDDALAARETALITPPSAASIHPTT